MNSRYAYEKPLPVSRLVNMVANSILFDGNDLFMRERFDQDCFSISKKEGLMD